MKFFNLLFLISLTLFLFCSSRDKCLNGTSDADGASQKAGYNCWTYMFTTKNGGLSDFLLLQCLLSIQKEKECNKESNLPFTSIL